ncbi:MAG: 50S ribosomal protein L6 [Saprospiraceae bacterium]|nr:50S ribosomal protein L6 [Saprospiraceae bacterium]
MSRIGNAPISLPKGVSIDITKGNFVTVKGPKGQLQEQIDQDMEISLEDGTITVKRPTEQQRHKAVHGLSRSLLSNMVNGVSTGFTKTMELVGVGYRATNTGNLLELIVGYSHPIMFELPKEIVLNTKTEKGSNRMVSLESVDKQLLGQVAAKIRAFRKPEPYKGKGIKFSGEIIRRKAGKTAGKGGKK